MFIAGKWVTPLITLVKCDRCGQWDTYGRSKEVEEGFTVCRSCRDKRWNEVIEVLAKHIERTKRA